MRINKYVAAATGLSRRAADQAIADGKISVNGRPPSSGQDVTPTDEVAYQGRRLKPRATQTIILNKPAGYVVSRNGQGDKTVYDLLPAELHHLKPVGRLDKYSSGLLLLTNDGALAQQLTHPGQQKNKIYHVELAQPLTPLHHQMISHYGVQLEDGISRLQLDRLHDGDDRAWRITMHEGRNRQIRRTFLSLGYGVSRLHRVQFGDYQLNDLSGGVYESIT